MAQRPVVLLVDDDPSMRDLLSNVFSLHGGFRIGGVCRDGFEAAMAASDLTPDIVVLDFFMPRWDGCKAAEYIRRACPNAKIVAFSAVLSEAPDWADHFVLKTDIGDLVPMVEGLCTAA